MSAPDILIPAYYPPSPAANDASIQTAIKGLQSELSDALDKVIVPPPNINPNLIKGTCQEFRSGGVLAFTGAATQTLFKYQFPCEIIEIVLQPDAGAQLQITEGDTTGGFAFSGKWTLSANQIWSEPGKLINGNLNLTSNGAVNVQFLVRYKVVS